MAFDMDDGMGRVAAGDERPAPDARAARGDPVAGRMRRSRRRPGLAIVVPAALVLGLIALVARGPPNGQPLGDALVRWGQGTVPTEPVPPTPTVTPEEGEDARPIGSVDGESAPGSLTGNGDIYFVEERPLSISADGRLVAFASSASNLVPGDTNVNFWRWSEDNARLGGCVDVFVRDIEAGKTWRASVDAYGDELQGESWAAALSPDGRFLAFRSRADLLMDGKYSQACAKREFPETWPAGRWIWRTCSATMGAWGASTTSGYRRMVTASCSMRRARSTPRPACHGRTTYRSASRAWCTTARPPPYATPRRTTAARWVSTSSRANPPPTAGTGSSPRTIPTSCPAIRKCARGRRGRRTCPPTAPTCS